MRLNRIQARNFIGARDVDIAIPTPIAVIAGENDAGKSSIFEAVALAMTGEMARVSLKKDYGQVVTDGAKDGQVVVDSTIGTCSFQVPSGTWGEKLTDEGKAFAPTIRYVLNAQRFAAMDETTRRKFLFGLMRSGLSADVVAARLKRRDGVAETMVAEILPTLQREGFEAASKEAARRATVSKGAWQEVTGEKWGPQKAQGWRAEVPDYDAAGFERDEAKLTSAKAELDAATQELGRLAGLQEAARSRDARITELDLRVQKRTEAVNGVQKCEDEVSFRRDDLAAAQKRLEEIVSEAPAAGPAARKGATKPTPAAPRRGEPPAILVDAIGVVRGIYEVASESEGIAGADGTVTPWANVPFYDMAVDLLVAFNRQFPDYASPDHAQDDPTPDLPATDAAVQAARDEASRRVRELDGKLKAAEEELQKARQRVSALNADAEQLAALRKERAENVPTSEQVDGHRNEMAEIRGRIAALETSTADARKAATAAQAAKGRTQRAAQHHEAIAGWDAVAKALAPDGIPGEILGETLAPLNTHLKTIAQQSDWPLVQIGADMSIKIDGRPYGLWSESGRWRADAALAAMIAAQSGIRYIVLDRIDVLSIANRGKLMRWLATAVRSGFLDGALLLGTLKAEPAGLPTATFTTAWLEKGHVASQQKAA